MDDATTPVLDPPPGYPREWEADVVLRNGAVAHLRPIVPGDAPAIQDFHSGQSEESIYLRFFAVMPRLSDKDLVRFTHVDYEDRVALVVTIAHEIVGIGRYERIDELTAEVAFNISDRHQGKGIGTVLLEHLADIAQEVGIWRFVADVLPQNQRMLAVFAEAGYSVSRMIDDGVVQVSIDLAPTDRSTEVSLAREHRAEAQSVRSLLHPEVVAVLGVSDGDQALGTQLVRRIVAGEYRGRVYAVGEGVRALDGIGVFESIRQIPESVDVAIIALPAHEVLPAIDECAAVGVKALVVASTGFAESGPEGAQLQDALLARARLFGMRVVGPNSFGVISNDPAVRLNASLAPDMPHQGHLGLFSQSGALGIAVLASASRRNLGVSSFISAGNRVDVSGNDLMQYWLDDDDTRAVGLYLESMGNPRKFSRIARNLSRKKPVIVVKSGLSPHAVPPGHRVRSTSARPEVFSAMLRQAGVIRVENVHQLFDVAQLVVHQPLPRGDRVAVVGNSPALNALAADACSSWELRIARGPIAVSPQHGAAAVGEAVKKAVADPGVDAVLICLAPADPGESDADLVAAVRRATADAGDVPCLVTFVAGRGVDAGSQHDPDPDESGPRRALPIYTMPEEAARALAAATRYAQWRSRGAGQAVTPAGVDRTAATDLVEAVLEESGKGRELYPDETNLLLSHYGIHVWPSVPVDTLAQATAAAKGLGFPVVLKSAAASARHQRLPGAARLDIGTVAGLRQAWASITELLHGARGANLVVQRMAPPGVSCVITSEEDPLFGPVLGFSIAGVTTELLRDIAYRIPPLNDQTVEELIDSPRSSPLLRGYKGATPVHRAALIDLVARVSALADDLPEVASLSLNPVVAHPGGVEVLGARVSLAPVARRVDPGRRALP